MTRLPIARAVSSPASLLLLGALFASAGAPAEAQQIPSPPLVEGWLAWDRGDYVEALESWLGVLDGPDGERWREEIALLTGELHEVREVAPDGREAAFGPRGRYASYEVEEEGVRRTVVFDAATLDPVARLTGHDARISPTGAIAALVIPPSTELVAMRDALRAAESREAFFEARRRLREAEALATRLIVRGQVGGDPNPLAFMGEDEGRPPRVVHPLAHAFDDRGRLWVLGADDPEEPACLLVFDPATNVLEDTGFCPTYGTDLRIAPGGGFAAILVEPENPLDTAGVEASPGGHLPDPPHVLLLGLDTWDEWELAADDFAFAPDGSAIVWWSRPREEDYVDTHSWSEPVDVRPETWVRVAPLRPDALDEASDPVTEPLIRSAEEMRGFALSPGGGLLAYSAMPFDDWEVFVVTTGVLDSGAASDPYTPPDDESARRNLTREIQHDLFPRFLDERTVLAMKGEGRHRRSFLYDVERGEATRLFHNNTVRTIAPEYEWAPSPDGERILIVADRDGNTVSPERGVYLLDRTRVVRLAALRARLERMLDSERALREVAERTFEPVADQVRETVGEVSLARLYGYAHALFDMGSKYITEPGNRMASEYLVETLRSFGYEPELQWFEPRPDIRTANVVVRVPGTVHPDVVYVASSHYDSVRDGPGADDDSSGTAALLEVARVLRERPREATVELAFFTGEEAGLLGSREYVRRARAEGKGIVGALNNDMIGWSENHRLDNTIRYSNDGIRDVQHGAAMLFSDLITYDSRYYQNTDAHAYYEAYGDIVGGIGSHPVLGNPHYHQPSDRIETINHRLVAEVAKVTAATLMLLADSPSRPTGVTLTGAGTDGREVRWDALPESDVARYEVRWERMEGGEGLAVVEGGEPTRVRIQDVRPGSVAEVWAVDERGMRSWDAGRVVVPGR